MTKLIIVIRTSKWTKKKKTQENKELVDLYRLTLTMLKITKGALMAQSSKQMCIILRIVRILSPTNNSTPGEGGVKSMWLVGVHTCHLICAVDWCPHWVLLAWNKVQEFLNASVNMCKVSSLKNKTKKKNRKAKHCLHCLCVYVCACGVGVFLSVLPPWFRVNEAVYRRLAQLVGAGV